MLKRVIVITIASVFAAFIIATGLLYFSKASARISPCVINLQRIQGAKIRWRNESHKKFNDTPNWNDIVPYLQIQLEIQGITNGIPVCPQGGTYTIGRVGEPPTCSISGPGHSLPP